MRIGARFALIGGLFASCGSLEATVCRKLSPEYPEASAIMRGAPARAAQYPAIGAILSTTEHNTSLRHTFLCTGVLIAPDVVLAAGHCNAKLLGDLLYPVHLSFSLAADVSEAAFQDAHDIRGVEVRRVVPHPEYKVEHLGPGLRDGFDLSLLILNQSIDDVRPVEMADTKEGGRLVTGASVVIVGYGVTRRDLTESGSWEVGRKNWGNAHLGQIGATEMQVGYLPNEAQKCYGDSGGPTLFDAGTQEAPREILVGITSRTFDELNCVAGGVDTRVDKYRPWIDRILAQTCRMGIRPSCAPRTNTKA